MKPESTELIEQAQLLIARADVMLTVKLHEDAAKQTFTSLLTLEIRSSIDFALKKPNQSWLSPRKAA